MAAHPKVPREAQPAPSQEEYVVDELPGTLLDPQPQSADRTLVVADHQGDPAPSSYYAPSAALTTGPTNTIDADGSASPASSSPGLPTQVALASPSAESTASYKIGNKDVVPLATISGIRTLTAVSGKASGINETPSDVSGGGASGARSPSIAATSASANVGASSSADASASGVELLTHSPTAAGMSITSLTSSAESTAETSTAPGITNTPPVVSETTLITASLSGISATASPNINAAAMGNDPPNSSNIFDRSNQLFPLAIVIIVVGALFLFGAVAIAWLRLSGCTQKRKLRSAIPTIYDAGEKGMWDPKVDAMPYSLSPGAADDRGNRGGRGVASTIRASTRAVHTYAPPVPPRPAPLGWEFINSAPTQQAYAIAPFLGGPPGPASTALPVRNSPPIGLIPPIDFPSTHTAAAVPHYLHYNPFHSMHDSLDVPHDAVPADSPVPSFATDRHAHDEDVLPCPKARGANHASENPFQQPAAPPSHHGNAPPPGQAVGSAGQVAGLGYGCVTLARSSSRSTASSPSSSYTVYSAQGARSAYSSGTDSMRSDYLAKYPIPALPGAGMASGEGAELERLRSAGTQFPQRSWSQASGSAEKLGKTAQWKLDT